MAGNKSTNTAAGKAVQGNLINQDPGAPAQTNISTPNKPTGEDRGKGDEKSSQKGAAGKDHSQMGNSRWAASEYEYKKPYTGGLEGSLLVGETKDTSKEKGMRGPQLNSPDTAKDTPGQEPSNTKGQIISPKKDTQQTATPHTANKQGTPSSQGQKGEGEGTPKRRYRRGCRAGKGKHGQKPQSGGTPAGNQWGQYRQEQEPQSSGQVSLNTSQGTTSQQSPAQGQGGSRAKDITQQTLSKPAASGTQQGTGQSRYAPQSTAQQNSPKSGPIPINKGKQVSGTQSRGTWEGGVREVERAQNAKENPQQQQTGRTISPAAAQAVGTTKVNSAMEGGNNGGDIQRRTFVPAPSQPVATRPAPSPYFAIVGEKGTPGIGWSPHAPDTAGPPALRRNRRPQANVPNPWSSYWTRIRIKDVIQEVYGNDKLDVESFQRFVNDETVVDSEKIMYLQEMVLTMDGLISHVNTINTDLKKLNEELSEEVKGAKAQADEYAEKLAAEGRHREELQQKVNKLGHTMTNLQRDLDTKESHIQAAEKENARLSEDLAARSGSHGAASRQNMALAKAVAVKDEEIVNLHREVEKLSGEMGGLRAKVKTQDSERQLLMEEIVNSPLQRENELLKSQLGEANDELASVNQNLQDLEVEFAVFSSKRQVGDNPPYTTMCAELEGLEEEEEEETGEFVDRNTFAPLEWQDDSTVGTQVSSVKGSSGPDSRASLCGDNTVSAVTQTVEVEVNQASTQTVQVGGSFMESSTQTVRVGDVLSSTQTEDSGIQETRDALMQTEPVTVVPGSGKWRGFILAMVMLTWAAIMLWSHKEDQRIWLEANDVSRSTLIGLREHSGEPLWLQTVRFNLAVWTQGDRVLPG